MRIYLLVLSLLMMAGCASSDPAVTGSELEEILVNSEEEANVEERYLIGVGDVLSINVWGNPELSLTVPVRPDGYISLPLVGDILANELSAESLAGSITSLLGTQLRNPQVAVMVQQVNSRVYLSRVRVTGAVQNPISIPYARGISVLDLILEAGGLTESASANRAKLYRNVDEKLYNLDVRLNDILLRGQLDTNYLLRPGDVLTVPERLF